MTTAQSCAKDLRELAADKRCVHRADDLKELADALTTGDSDTWAGVDLLAAFPESTTASTRKFGLTEMLLGAGAAVFVFAPVAWTWFSLRAASQAYLDMTADGVKPDDTFLGLWISGFEGHLGSAHRLVPMAVVSILLIVLAAVLVILQRIVGHAADRKDESEALMFESRRVSILCAVQREIGGLHAADPSAIEAIVRSSIRKLSEAHDATKEGLDRLNATSVSLETATATMSAAADAARVSSQGAEQAAVALQSATNESHHRISETLDNFSDGLKNRLASAQVETSTVIARSSDTIKSAIDDLVAGVELTEQSQRAVANSIDTMDRRSVDSSRELHSVVVDLRSAVEEVERSLHHHESAMQAQASELTAARDAVEMMLRRLELMGNDAGANHVDAL
ncbi:hypothetical protein ACFWB0_06205 [Rhodococcus sp. NPDC060086]|uniref:hypothetical protein n=1 Tax=Rhodococcus sp. NPDC060086 TaxID=3347055 RepID=UPI00366783AF